jgi:hypothetical protein
LTGWVVNAEAACVPTKKAITPAMTRSVLLIGPPLHNGRIIRLGGSVSSPCPSGRQRRTQAFEDEWLRSASPKASTRPTSKPQSPSRRPPIVGVVASAY